MGEGGWIDGWERGRSEDERAWRRDLRRRIAGSGDLGVPKGDRMYLTGRSNMSWTRETQRNHRRSRARALGRARQEARACLRRALRRVHQSPRGATRCAPWQAAWAMRVPVGRRCGVGQGDERGAGREAATASPGTRAENRRRRAGPRERHPRNMRCRPPTGPVSHHARGGPSTESHSRWAKEAVIH